MIPTMKRAGILFFAISLLFLGCSRPRPRIESLPLPDIRNLKERIEKNRARLRDFKGLGLIQVYGPETRAAMGVNVRYLATDYLQITLRGAMGIEVGTLALAEGRYHLSYPGSRIPPSGEIEDIVLPEEFALPIRGAELVDLFLPFPSEPKIPSRASVQRDLERQEYLLAWDEDSTYHQLWADPFKPVITKELLTSSAGDTVWYKELGSIKKRSKVFMPSEWNVQIGSGHSAITVKMKLSSLWINSGLAPSDFDTDGKDDNDTGEDPFGG